MKANKNDGSEFEIKVQTLLRLKGYNVQRDQLINGTQIDLIAIKKDIINNICLIVECSDRQDKIGVSLLKEKAAVLSSLDKETYLFRLLFVSRIGFTKEAKTFAKSKADIILLTFADLENEIVDFTPYFDWYCYNFENSIGFFKEGNLFNKYVSLSVTDNEENIYPSINTEVTNWLHEKDNNLLFILGEYGSGKTSFCRQFVYDLLQEKYNGGNGYHIPILINLRDYRNSLNIQQLITDTLINHYRIDTASFKAFEYVCSLGHILLVLDGFDEMAGGSDKQTVLDCFSQIFILAELNTKIILTCRSNFFKTHFDIIELFRSFSIDLPLTIKEKSFMNIALKNKGKILNVNKLDKKQIREYILKKIGEKGDALLYKLKKIHDLSDLSSRPVLLDMILLSLPEVLKSKANVNSAVLYESYTNSWTFRDNWRIKTPLEFRQDFCIKLAWSMHQSGEHEINSNVLNKILDTVFEKAQDKKEILKNDIQTCSFLIRTSNSDIFRFAHKSFLEFFVAKNIVSKFLKNKEHKPIDTIIENSPKEITKKVQSIMDFYNEKQKDIIIDGSYDSTFYYINEFISLHLKRVYHLDFSSEKNFINEITHKPDSILYSEILSIISNQNISKSGERIMLSEEIATFCIELIDINQIIWEDLIQKIEDDNLEIFIDVLRLNKSKDFVVHYSKEITDYLINGQTENLKLGFFTNLLLSPSNINFNLVKALRDKLSPKNWTFILFLLTKCENKFIAVFEQCKNLDSLRPIDKLICSHGIKGNKLSSIDDFLSIDYLLELLDSSDLFEQEISLFLFPEIDVPFDRIQELYKKVINLPISQEKKDKAIKHLAYSAAKKGLPNLKNVLNISVDSEHQTQFDLSNLNSIINLKSIANWVENEHSKDSHSEIIDNFWILLRNHNI